MRRTAGRPRARSRTRRVPGARGSRVRGRRATTASVRSASVVGRVRSGPSAASARIAASPTSRSRCWTCRRSTATADDPPISRAARTSISWHVTTVLVAAEAVVDDDERGVADSDERVDCGAGRPPVVEVGRDLREQRGVVRPAERGERGVDDVRVGIGEEGAQARFDPPSRRARPRRASAPRPSRSSDAPGSARVARSRRRPRGGPRRRPARLSANATATVTSERSRSRAPRSRRRSDGLPAAPSTRIARGPARRATDRRGASCGSRGRVRGDWPRAVRARRCGRSPVRRRRGAGASPSSSGCSAIVRMSSPSRTSRSSSLPTRRSIAIRLLSSSTVRSAGSSVRPRRFASRFTRYSR